MTVVDIIIIFVIVLSAIFSLMRGFVKEAVSLATWILAITLSIFLSPKLSNLLTGFIESEAVRLAAAFGMLFLIVLIAGAVVNMVIARFIKKTGLSGADRVFGVAFGFVRGLLIVVVFVAIGGMTPLPQQDWWQASQFLGYFETIAIYVRDLLPENMMSFDKVAV